MEVLSSFICMAKFPRVAHSVAHVQPIGSDVGSSPVSFVWDGQSEFSPTPEMPL